VAVGFEVGFRTGLKSRRAVLADLSVRGCRLLSEAPIDAGRRIRVNVPEALETGDPVSIAGRVLRVDRPKESDRQHLYSAAVLFDDLGRDAREAVELLIEDLSLGPATLRKTLPPTAPVVSRPQPRADVESSRRDGAAEPSLAPEANGADAQAGDEDALDVDVRLDPEASHPEAASASARDRRSSRRAAYSHTVPAFGKRALRVLVGRDLSVSGMRIEPLPGLSLDDRLHLAIYGDPGESPFLVWGTVTRDDGDAGMALRFDPLDPAVGERLERLVSSLPSVESLHDTEAQAMGSVMTEILSE
jgi:hypothetical protein